MTYTREEWEALCATLEDVDAAMIRQMLAENDRMRKALVAIDDGYGPNHMSKFARDKANEALK